MAAVGTDMLGLPERVPLKARFLDFLDATGDLLSMRDEYEIPRNVFEAAKYTRYFREGALREVACNLCGATKARALLAEGAYRVQKCHSCGLVYVSPQPTEEALGEYYAQFYPKSSAEVVASWSHQASFRQVRSILRRHCPQGGRLIDAGSGMGTFLQTLGVEWHLTGIDPDATACDRARRAVPRAEILQGDVLSMPLPAKKFDAATLLASLEHMLDPTSVLRRVAELLAAGGLILVTVPYIEWYLCLKRLIPSLPVRFGAPRHLYDFSPRTLRLILENNGYKVVRLYIGSQESWSSPIVAAAVGAMKVFSKTIYYATGRHWIVPFCGSLVVVGRRMDG